MKVRSLLLGVLCMSALSVVLSSCSDDDNDRDWDDNGSTVELPYVRAYFLNEGTGEQNNAGIAFYAPNKEKDVIGDIYKVQNKASLGDTGQDMIAYEDCIYVSVYGSNYLAKLNAACVEQARVSFVGDDDLSAGIRYIAAHDGYIYASFYGGVVAKINANTLKVEKKLTGYGDNLEGVAICDDMLYVANSYKIENGHYIYLEEVFVFDLHTFSFKETLTVATNPNKLVEEDDKAYLVSWDYSAESHVLQMIDSKNNNKVTELGYATHVAAEDDMLYCVDSRVNYDNWPETSAVNTFYTYNVKTGTKSSASFLKNAPEELATAVVYMIAIDDESDDIYIGTTGHSNANGDIYRFRKDGTYMEKFDCGGQNPTAAVFFN